VGEASNRHMLRRLRPFVVSDVFKRRQLRRRVGVRKTIAGDVSLFNFRCHQNRRVLVLSGRVRRVPADWPGGDRHGGDVSLTCCFRMERGESAGINRHGERDENARHRRSSDPRWPRVMRWRPARAQRSVDRVRAGQLWSREITVSGCRRRLTRRKATLSAALARAARRAPRGLRTCACTESSCARTGRSHCSPVRLITGAGRSGNAEAVSLG
jgi:hypothetical protein